MDNDIVERLLNDLAEALAQDERVLTSGERDLLVKVAKYVQDGATSEVEKEAADRFSRAVAAAVIDRVLGVIGVVISQRLLRPQASSLAGDSGEQKAETNSHKSTAKSL